MASGLAVAAVGTLVGACAGALARRGGRAQRWHRRLAAPAPARSRVVLPAPLAYGPATLAAPLGVAAFARPWGPLPDAVALCVALLAGSLALLATGLALAAWRRRRMRELYPDWLSFLSVALDFGVPLASAAAIAAAGLEPPLRGEAERLARGLEGSEPAAALERFAAAVGTPEAQFVTSLLARQRHLGVSVASILLEEEGLLSRERWQERRARQGVVPYAFTAAVGVLLVNAAVLFLVPRAAALVGTLRLGGP